ncbi:zinc-binding dehydrogenase [Streptomyces avermitilis]|uniref:zinc-binding dehydrogenase n=1 Tax=Streptomyces avermitilis TaxID=33903 RepID=UPI003F4CCBF2
MLSQTVRVFFVVEPDRTQLEKITQLIDSGRLKPMADRVAPLLRAREAYEALEQEHPREKVVIQIAPHDPPRREKKPQDRALPAAVGETAFRQAAR